MSLISPAELDARLKLKDVIEELPHFNQLEILRIMSKYPLIYDTLISENSSGVYIDIANAEISGEIIDEIQTYIKHVRVQESHLLIDEQTKQDYKSAHFGASNKST